jgi:hypothetical protein
VYRIVQIEIFSFFRMTVVAKIFLLLVAVGAAHAFTAAPMRMSLQSNSAVKICRPNFAATTSPLSKPLSAALAAALVLGGPMVPNALAATVANPYARVSLILRVFLSLGHVLPIFTIFLVSMV